LRWSNACHWRDIFSTLAEYCSLCCSFWTRGSRDSPSRREQMPICPPSAFILTRNGRSELFSTPACLRSLLHRSQEKRAASRRRRLMSPSKRRSGRHLRRCNHPMPNSYNRPIPKSENRICNARARLQGGTRRRSLSWQRGNRNWVGLGTASGEVNLARLQRAEPNSGHMIKVMVSLKYVLNKKAPDQTGAQVRR